MASISRRRFLSASAGVLAAVGLPRFQLVELAWGAGRLPPDLADIERLVGGRLGVAAVDAASGRRLDYRSGERFPMCSTFKWLLATQILWRVDRNEESLERVVRYGADDLLAWAPVTRRHVAGGGMTVAALLAAAIEESDNTAANLLLASIHGPASLTAFVRRLGDRITRLDRTEPDLNAAVPGDPRDTTSPAAMVADMERVLTGDVLAGASRARLLGWLEHAGTGKERLRAGFPAAWRAGDKTGSGGHGTTNDVAVAWPAPHAPVLVAAYLTETSAPNGARNAALAQVGDVVARWIGAHSRAGRGAGR